MLILLTALDNFSPYFVPISDSDESTSWTPLVYTFSHVFGGLCSVASLSFITSSAVIVLKGGCEPVFTFMFAFCKVSQRLGLAPLGPPVYTFSHVFGGLCLVASLFFITSSATALIFLPSSSSTFCNWATFTSQNSRLKIDLVCSDRE